MKLNFIEVETSIKIKLCAILEQLNQSGNRAGWVSNFVDNCIVEEEEHFDRYCNVLPVFGFNSAKSDINLIKSNLFPLLVDERDIEPTVKKKANQFVSFKFGDIQLLDNMNFLGGATSLDFSLKLTRPNRQKASFPTNGSIVQSKRTIKNFFPMAPSLAFCAIATPLKKFTTTFKTLLTVV